ncbi:ROK family protein [Chitinophaga sancti]|uniref:ROK family protein n=1 Tax=Chitinophaga sancti TaxID=1004 RepID=UPI003F7AF38D
MAQHNLLAEIQNGDITGVAYKNLSLKKEILSHFTNEGNATITDLGKILNASTPKITLLITELIETGLVKDYGKTESASIGRRPNIYGLASDCGFFVGVEVKNNHVNIGLLDFRKNLIRFKDNIPYALENTQASLDELCKIIKAFITAQKMKPGKILGVGINLTGRINCKTGQSHSYFNFSREPLSKIMEKRIGIPTFLENDTRAMAYGEFTSGAVQGEENALFVNIDYGIAVGIMINGELYYGKSGYAGEFGHIPFFQNEIICRCGKKGCLETETSGRALADLFIKRLKSGATSSVTAKVKKMEDITMEDIIDAAINDDTLSMELIEEIGEKLGKAIAVLINVFNPELIILGGCMAATGDNLYLPVKSAIKKFSLSLVNSDTKLRLSQLGDKAGVIGACMLIRKRLFN